MGKVVVIIIGLLCGVGQFFTMRYTLRPLAEGGTPQVFKLMLLQIPIPLVLLLGCAFVDTGLLPFTGGAFCLSMIIASVANYLITLKKKG